MEIQKDFRELLELFNTHNVDYVIVGGYALAFHGAPRFTGDIDILIKPNEQTSKRILAALDEFGFASLDISEDDFDLLDRSAVISQPEKFSLESILSIYQNNEGLSVPPIISSFTEGKFVEVDLQDSCPDLAAKR